MNVLEFKKVMLEIEIAKAKGRHKGGQQYPSDPRYNKIALVAYYEKSALEQELIKVEDQIHKSFGETEA